MATQDNRRKNTDQSPEAADDESSGRRRRDEAEARARQGQSLAMGDTGDRHTGVEGDTQGISNRPGDTEGGEEAPGGTTPKSGAKKPHSDDQS